MLRVLLLAGIIGVVGLAGSASAKETWANGKKIRGDNTPSAARRPGGFIFSSIQDNIRRNAARKPDGFVPRYIRDRINKNLESRKPDGFIPRYIRDRINKNLESRKKENPALKPGVGSGEAKR